MEKGSMVFMVLILGIVWGGFLLCIVLDLLSGGRRK